jgi:UDP-N-acetylmuramoyl-tripeptide--D-alanyl-D-alanine ligase
MAAALAVLAATPCSGRRIAYLGDMGELGPQEKALHAGLAALEAAGMIDVIHCVGPLMNSLHAALPEGRRGSWFGCSADAVQGLEARHQPGDIVLAKGSNSMGLSKIVDGIREMGHAAASHNTDK